MWYNESKIRVKEKMTIPTTTPPGADSAYQPTPSQRARESSLRRFNLIFVYIPTAVLGLVVLGLIVFMIWVALTSSPEDQVISLFSGVANIFLISCVILPAMLLCALGPAMVGFLIYRANERRKLPPPEKQSKLQKFLWKIDSLVETIQHRLRNSYLDQAANPLIKGHAIVAALRTIVDNIRKLYSRLKG